MRLQIERQRKLHCDNCHHEEPIEGPVGPTHVDTHCPLCNTNMLTREDYLEYRRVERRMAWMERGLRVLAWLGVLKEGQVARVQVKDGDTIAQFRRDGLL